VRHSEDGPFIEPEFLDLPMLELSGAELLGRESVHRFLEVPCVCPDEESRLFTSFAAAEWHNYA
jgi:hypothetical protein